MAIYFTTLTVFKAITVCYEHIFFHSFTCPTLKFIDFVAIFFQNRQIWCPIGPLWIQCLLYVVVSMLYAWLCHIGITIWTVWCKTAVSLLLMHWRYCSLALNHRNQGSVMCRSINSFRPGQNGYQYADDIFRCIFLKENLNILTVISVKFVPQETNGQYASIGVGNLDWHWIGVKPLS